MDKTKNNPAQIIWNMDKVEDCAKKLLENHKDINMVIEAKNASVVCIKDGYDYMFYLK